VPAGSEPAQVAQILKELIAEHNLESDRYLLAWGPRRPSFVESLFPSPPTEDRSGDWLRPRADLPLGIDDLAVDFVKREQLANGQQGVLAAAIPSVSSPPFSPLSGRRASNLGD